MLDLFLDPDSRPKHKPFFGDLNRLASELGDELRNLAASSKSLQGPPRLIIVTGHPGSGKSTLVRALSSLSLPSEVATFHVDDHIDWCKVVTCVDSNKALSAADYVRTANSVALTLALETFAD
jgi:hypothetical protein